LNSTLTAELVDYHIHLDLYPDCERVFVECAEQQIDVLTVTTTPKAWPRNLAMAEGLRSIRVALGLHPQVVAERFSELSLFEQYLPEARFVGEVGLDAGPRFYRSFDTQRKVFERILQLCSEAGDKIISVHSSRAARHVLKLIEDIVDPDRCHVVLHWFSGTNADAKRAFALGCYFSINQTMLKSPKGRALVCSIPTQRLLTETDGPFCGTRHGSVAASDVQSTVCELANVLGCSIPEARSLIAANLRTLEGTD
jgi:TatD DNase family protein